MNKNDNVKKIISAFMLAASMVLIIVGIVLGQNNDVLQKAIRICLECIGIG